MALVPYLSADDVDAAHRSLLDRPINLFRALINTPEGFSKFHALAEWVRWDCTLDPRARELLILQVGYLTGDEYEWSHHVILSRQFGVTADDIRGLIDYAEGRPTSLSEEDRTLLDASTQLTLHRHIEDSTWHDLQARYDDRNLTDIVLVTAMYSMVVRVLGGLRVDVEPDWAEPLAEFPLRPTEPR